MLCEYCQSYREDVRPYIFYYGNVAQRIYRYRSTTTRYSIKGSQKTLLCNNCVFTHAMQVRARGFRKSALFVLPLACLIAIVAFINQDPNGAEIAWLVSALLFAYAFSLFLTGLVEKKRAQNHDFASLTKAVREDRGSRLAIEVHKGILQDQGYYECFTPLRLKRIQRIKLPSQAPVPAAGK